MHGVSPAESTRKEKNFTLDIDIVGLLILVHGLCDCVCLCACGVGVSSMCVCGGGGVCMSVRVCVCSICLCVRSLPAVSVKPGAETPSRQGLPKLHPLAQLPGCHPGICASDNTVRQ